MPRPSIRERLSTAVAERAAKSAVRMRRTVASRTGVRVVVDGRELLNFCSNDYLGLADHPAIVSALREVAAEHGAGATASHLVCGHHALHEAAERELADWLGWPRALLFGAGYAANLGVLQALLGAEDLCVQDRLNHASLVDGARLAGCMLKRYPHGDAEGARRQLRSLPAAAAVLATDGVFSMDGDLAPLPALARIAREEGALLYVDDAHGVGVVGDDGRGSVAAAGLDARAAPLLLVTFGKALGGYGAAVLGEAAIIEHLAQSCRAYVYTTALPPAQAAATLVAIRIARAEAWRREKLRTLVARFRRGAAELGLPLMASPTPIQPIVLGDNARALAASRALEAQGFWVSAIRPPTVPEGASRLRVTLSAAHAEADVDALLAALAAAVPPGKAPP